MHYALRVALLGSDLWNYAFVEELLVGFKTLLILLLLVDTHMESEGIVEGGEAGMRVSLIEIPQMGMYL